MDRHGVEIVKHGKQKYYSPDFKINAINRVLLNHESSVQVSLDLGLPNMGMLSLWIKAFKEMVLCQEKVQIKYALLMLSYPAKASALSSNAA